MGSIPAAAVHRSTTRRKACAGCVSAKRRCDLTIPTCARCKLRDLECVYVGGNSSMEAVGKEQSPASRHSSDELPKGDLDFLETWSDSLPTDNASVVSPYLDQTKVVSMPGSSTTPFNYFLFPEYSAVSTRQTTYMVNTLIGWITSFVYTNKTPFIHPILYEDHMPSMYQDTLGICSRYLHKTPTNQAAFHRALDAKIITLVETSYSALGRLEDALLTVQMLLLFQIIRFFDGDVRQFANAERNLVFLDSWTLTLNQYYYQALGRLEETKSYANWVLVESIRRTNMMATVLRGVYNIMTQGYCDSGPLLMSLPVSSNTGKLWSATDMNDKTEMENESSSILSYREYSEEWNKGKVTDVEEYEKLLLVVCPTTIGTESF